MLKRWQKHLFYTLMSPLMKINGIRHRVLDNFRPKSPPLTKVHLGPGQSCYIDSWVNCDANMFTGKCDKWIDLRNPLPFSNCSVDAIYSHHVIEHLPDIGTHFIDIFRVLKPGGVYRVGGPNGDQAIAKFAEGDSKWFDDWPDNYKSLGGRFVNFVFCRGEHLTMLTESFLNEVATDSGFSKGVVLIPHFETGHPELFSECLKYESETTPDFPHTLIMEFRKP